MNERARSAGQSTIGGNGDDQNEVVQIVGSDDLGGGDRAFSIGELLSIRVAVVDGEMSPGQYASLVLYHLNQGDLTPRLARRLLQEFGFDVEPIERGVHTLVSKRLNRR